MHVDQIGMAAGAVWSKLSEETGEGSGYTLTQLKKIGGFTSDEIVAAIGWLAREGKIAFDVEKKKTVLRLASAELVA